MNVDGPCTVLKMARASALYCTKCTENTVQRRGFGRCEPPQCWVFLSGEMGMHALFNNACIHAIIILIEIEFSTRSVHSTKHMKKSCVTNDE